MHWLSQFQICTWVHCFLHRLAKPSRTCAWPLALRNRLDSPTPELAGTLWNPPAPSAALRNRNLHQHTPEPSGTFRNLIPEPAPARTGIMQNPLEPSGTCACTGALELIWAEDPISLRWEKKSFKKRGLAKFRAFQDIIPSLYRGQHKQLSVRLPWLSAQLEVLPAPRAQRGCAWRSGRPRPLEKHGMFNSTISDGKRKVDV